MKLESMLPLAFSLFTVMGLCIVLWGIYWLLIKRHPELGKEQLFPRQVFIMGLALFCIIAIVFVLPINVKSRDQLIGLIGLLASGIIAFSSTTVIANLMAGILLRVTKPFRVGDFIRVCEYFGRVVERGLFDTEIQAENRDLISIPNTYLIINPVSAVRSSGTVVTATLSLGYDIHHSRVESLLLRAAEESGLQEPFVHILELGNYAITYRVAGFLPDVKGLLTSRSNLYRSVLDVLHGCGVEIMSPAFMNQRRLAESQRIIPPVPQKEAPQPTVVAEEIVFDKAEQAEQVEEEKSHLLDEIKDLEKKREGAKGEEKKHIEEAIANTCGLLKALEGNGKESNRPNMHSAEGVRKN
jgi:small conductance mechanosensitive channel